MESSSSSFGLFDISFELFDFSFELFDVSFELFDISFELFVFFAPSVFDFFEVHQLAIARGHSRNYLLKFGPLGFIPQSPARQT